MGNLGLRETLGSLTLWMSCHLLVICMVLICFVPIQCTGTCTYNYVVYQNPDLVAPILLLYKLNNFDAACIA